MHFRDHNADCYQLPMHDYACFPTKHHSGPNVQLPFTLSEWIQTILQYLSALETFQT